MTNPHRVQLSRKKGWKLPPNTVVVSRPTRWGNPFRVDISNGIDSETAVHLFKRANSHPHAKKRIREELRGKNLACWCPLDQPCHADVLLKIANSDL
jgi:hypothetical protein